MHLDSNFWNSLVQDVFAYAISNGQNEKFEVTASRRLKQEKQFCDIWDRPTQLSEDRPTEQHILF